MVKRTTKRTKTGPAESRSHTADDLEALYAKFEAVVSGGAAAQRARPADAIDRVLAAPARQTSVPSVRQTAPFLDFKRELQDGLIRVDAAHKILDLVNRAMTIAAAI